MTDGRGEPAPSWGLSGWIGAVALYLAFNVATQLAASPTANYDQAEMLVLAQELRWGYTAQPPLYVWLSALPEALAGPGLAQNLALKTLLLAGSVGLCLAMLRRAGGGRERAPLVLAGFALVPVVIWESQRVLTHTALAVLLVLAALWQAPRLRAAPTAAGYLGWGAIAGAAVIAKYNTAIALAALAGALLWAPGWRAVLRTPRMGWSVAGALLVAGPHAAWLAGNLGAVGPTLRKLDRADAPLAFVAGLAELAGALASYAGGLALVWLAVSLLRRLGGERRAGANPADVGPAGPAVRAGIDPATGKGAGAAAGPSSIAPGLCALQALVSRQLLLGVALTAAIVVATGSRHFEERWLLPVLAPLPLWLALSVQRADLRRGLLVGGALLALVAAALLPGRVLFAERLSRGKPAVVSLPYVALAGSMRAAHGEPAAILADTQTLGGNLRLVFPGARILVPGVTRLERPAAGAVWAIYEDSDCEGRPLTPRVDEARLRPVPGVACEVHEAPLLHHRKRMHRLHLQVMRDR